MSFINSGFSNMKTNTKAALSQKLTEMYFILFPLSKAFPSLGGGDQRLPLHNPRPAKRQKVVFIQPKKSWTHDFCLLAETNQSRTPSLTRLSAIKEAGLGKKRIVFPDKNAGFAKLKSVLETEYPKLKSQDGAFELMRAQGGGYSRPLCLIPIPSDGYSVPYLKEMVGTSTTIYIRPMKESLSAEKAPVSLSPDSPLTECTTCNKQVPIFALRQHSKDCGAIDINSDTEEIEDILKQDDSEVMLEDIANLNTPSTSEVKIVAVNTPSTSEVKIVADSDIPGTSKQNWLSQLELAFPNAEKEDLQDIASVAITIDDAACLLLDKQTADKEENLSLEDLIESFVEKNELSGDECILVDRETLWMDVVKFYKRSLTKPDILRKELCVSFKNEEGLDGGAMKIEFFSLALNEVKSRLFEGAEPNMVPIKDATKGMLFQLAGVIVSHALFQRSSIGFPFLAPHIYSYIVGEEEDETISKITKEHIPLDSSTALLHEFINCLETCENDDDIHQLLEENSKCEAFWQIINSSRWPKEKVISMSSKDFLLQHLVSHELLVSRKNEIQEFSEGLKSLSLLKLLQKNKEICTILFIAGEFQPLTADGIMEMIIAVETHSFSERQAYEWLKSYINEDEDEEFPGDSRQRALLQFWTGWTVVPFCGLAKRLKVAFLADDDTKSLPTTSSCTAVLRIPTVHSSKKGFFEAMNIALKFGRVGFPNP